MRWSLLLAGVLLRSVDAGNCTGEWPGENNCRLNEVPTDQTAAGGRCFPTQVAQRSSFLDVFPDEGQAPYRMAGAAPDEFVLEIRTWDSHKIVTRMAQILLTEKLGYKVKVVKYGSGRYIYDRLRTSMVDANLECWPGNHDSAAGSDGTETKPPAVAAQQVGGGAPMVGATGYSGQSGWFISEPALRPNLPLYVMSSTDDNTWEVQNLTTAAYRSLTLAGFGSWSEPLARGTDVPAATGSYTCANSSLSDIMAPAVQGLDPNCNAGNDADCDDEYDCSSGDPNCSPGLYTCDETTGIGEWFVDDGLCCPRNLSASTHCAPYVDWPTNASRPPDCVAIVANGGGDFDDKKNRGLVAGFRDMPMQMVYAPYRDTVAAMDSISKPIIFYRWESDYLLVTSPNTFIRIDLTVADRTQLALSACRARACACAPRSHRTPVCPHGASAPPPTTRCSPSSHRLR